MKYLFLGCCLVVFFICSCFITPLKQKLILTVEGKEEVYRTNISEETEYKLRERNSYKFPSYYDAETGNISFDKEDGFPKIVICRYDGYIGFTTTMAAVTSFLICIILSGVYLLYFKEDY